MFLFRIFFRWAGGIYGVLRAKPKPKPEGHLARPGAGALDHHRVQGDPSIDRIGSTSTRCALGPILVLFGAENDWVRPSVDFPTFRALVASPPGLSPPL